MEFEELKSITSTIAAHLHRGGVNTVEALAMQTLDELKAKLPGVPEEKIRELQLEVWKALGYWFMPASQLIEMRKKLLTFPTGSKALDKMLGGGVRTGSITEFCGEYGSGKTECLLTLMVETLGRNKDYGTIFFDSEATYSQERVEEIARQRGFEPEAILDRTTYVRIWHSQHFKEAVAQADTLIKKGNVKLILVDSIIAPIRAEYLGREVLWYRQQVLNSILRDLLNYAKAFNLAVVVTNQVVANPQVVYSQDPVLMNPPTGGHILAHNAETRIYLRKGEGNRRIARLIDSSWLPPGECVFRITEKGVEDVEVP